MFYSDIITLIGITEGKNAAGEITEAETETEVYADCRSVTRSEFYAAQTAGIKAEIAFTVKAADYDDQQKIVYNCKGTGESEDDEVYDVIRTYQKDPDNIEIVCKRGVR
ncbi:MAG: head-tail adaptor protein [Eubacteriales bacterium]|nr:head-tail adaptor protein [Eubacteriales bacterium]